MAQSILITDDGALADAVEAALRERPDLVITDVRMPPTGTDDGLRAALDLRAGRAGLLHRLVQQEMRAVRAVALDHVGDRVLPFLRFDGVDVRSLIFHHVSLG